jgi:two-component system, cell cycle sensor histidine kinase and response regulator CckA
MVEEATALRSMNLAEAAVGDLLGAAITEVRALLDHCPPGDPMRSGLRKVQQTVERLAALTGDLDGLNRRTTPRATAIDLNAVVRDMMASLQRLLGPFITLETTLHVPTLWAAGDRSRLEQVTLGLVINAREALPLGGKVRVTTRRWVLSHPTAYRIGSLPAGDWAVLEVRDNGAGIDAGGFIHLLEPSSRGLPFDSSLSLSTVSTVVTEAGGHVILDMPDDGGTVLAACFPAVEAPRVRQPATGTANAVLIVDDDEWSRMSAARTLRHAGFGVLEAGHADDAMELLNDVAGSCVRLLVADAKLLQAGLRPLGDRVRLERPEIEIVVTASHRSSTGGDGRTPVLTKPFAPEDLLHTIRDRFLALS